jgi:hypothetical protein
MSGRAREREATTMARAKSIIFQRHTQPASETPSVQIERAKSETMDGRFNACLPAL